jgi:endonuclease YncB( thermonuclease family)
MPFRLVKGKFAPRLGRPDGDSVRFIPDNVTLLNGLLGRTVKIYHNQGETSVQLRYEGIDTLEKAAIAQFSSAATKANMKALGGPGSTNQADTPGFILTRRIGPNRRPICFVYPGATDEDDGTDVFVDAAWVRKSVNYKLMRAGHAYPIFYNTLFAELRVVLVSAMNAARGAGLGVWAKDRSMSGVKYSGPPSLATMPPIFPKLWRRLQKYGRSTLADFIAFVAATNEQVTTMSDDRDLQLEDVIRVSGDMVRLTYPPEDLKFRSEGA